MRTYSTRETLAIFGRSYCHRIECSVALFATVIAFAVLWPTQSALAALQVIQGQAPPGIATLTPTGNLAATQQLNLAISLPLRNTSELTNLLQQLYDPASTNYHHYLTPAQFTEKFGPSVEDYQKVIAFAQAHSLAVTYEHSNRVILDLVGSVADIESAMHVHLHVYQHPTETRTFYAPDVNPSIDLDVPILGIAGLNNYAVAHPAYNVRPSNALNPALSYGSGPSGSYGGYDFRHAYAPGVTLTGYGQAVGLLEFGGYLTTDINYYETKFGLPNVPLVKVPVDGGAGPYIDLEVALDIEMAIAMAPGLSEVIVYEAPTSYNSLQAEQMAFEDMFARMADDDLAKQLSCSWALSIAKDSTVETILQQMQTQGQSFLQASGDDDAYNAYNPLAVYVYFYSGQHQMPLPVDSPNVTSVGGTTLTTSLSGSSWASETVWNWGQNPNNVVYNPYTGLSGPVYMGSGGGISGQYSIPSWQMGVSMSANLGSTTMRNIPDVALTADNIYVRFNGTDYPNGSTTGPIGGTSAAAPLWAGLTALVNQQAAGNGRPSVGFLNPALYAIGEGANYSSCFHDTINGNNKWQATTAWPGGSPNLFSAVSGYDLCTGWGTPAGQSLINALSPLPTTPTITTVVGNHALGGTYSGDGGPAIAAGLSCPVGIWYRSHTPYDTFLVIADFGNAAIRGVNIGNDYIDSWNSGYGIYTISPLGVALDVNGYVYLADGDWGSIREYQGGDDPIDVDDYGAGISAALDGSGHLYSITESGDYVIKTDCVIPWGDSWDGINVPVAGNGTAGHGGDGGPATGPLAQLNVDVFLPTTHGVIVPSTTVDGQGNIYIADMGNNEVRKVDHATQNISTVAGNWSLGAGYNGDYIPATSAQLKYPAAVAVDTQGNLYIADSGNNRIRRVDHVTHIITTVAGTGTAGYYGDNGPAINARLNSPSGLAFDPSGNLYISDSGNDVIRKLTF
jgi:hypothetical protein